jgi:L-lactate dehydrogenase complex protein LldF
MRKLREQQVQKNLRPWPERFGLRLWTWAATRPAVYGVVTRIAARIGKWMGGRDRLLHRLPAAGAEWTSGRDFPAPRGRTFRELYARPRSRRTR